MEDWDRPSEEPILKPVQSNNSDEPPTKKSKKKSKLRQAIAQSKPIFDPSLNSFFFEKCKFYLLFSFSRRKNF